MGARQKLNKIHVIGSLGVAGLLGLATGSVAVFVIASTVLIAGSIYAGEIRPHKGKRQ